MSTVSTLRRLFGAVAMLLTGNLIGSLFSFFSAMLLARALTVTEFGRVSALLVAVNLCTPVGSAGVNFFLLRVFGAEGWAAIRWLRAAASLVALATALACVVLSLYLCLSGIAAGQSDLLVPAATLILTGQIAVEVGSAIFQLEDRYGALTSLQVSTQSGRFLVIVVAGLHSMLTEVGILAGYGLIGLALTLITLRSASSLRRRAASRVVQTNPQPLGHALAESSPYALITIFYILYFQGTVAIVAWLAGPAAAAEYNAAFLIFSALSLIPGVIYTKFLAARLCRWAENDRAIFAAVFHVGAPAMALCGGVIALVLIVTAHWLVPLLFGAKYADAATLVMIRAVGVPLAFVQMTFSSLFISRRESGRKILYLGITAGVSIALNVLLVPWFGVIGGAVTSVVAEAILLILHVNGAVRNIRGVQFAATFRLRTIVASARHLLDHDFAGADLQTRVGGVRPC